MNFDIIKKLTRLKFFRLKIIKIKSMPKEKLNKNKSRTLTKNMKNSL